MARKYKKAAVKDVNTGAATARKNGWGGKREKRQELSDTKIGEEGNIIQNESQPLSDGPRRDNPVMQNQKFRRAEEALEMQLLKRKQYIKVLKAEMKEMEVFIAQTEGEIGQITGELRQLRRYNDR